MAQNDELIIKTLMEIKGDIGGLSSDVQGIKDSLAKNDNNIASMRDHIRKMGSLVNMIPGHIQYVKDTEVRLNERIWKIETDVKTIKDTDLPALKDQLVIQKWLSSNRNKIIALVGVGLLGAAGSIAAGLIKDTVKVSIAHPEASASRVPAVTRQPVVELPDAVSMSTDLDANP